MDLPSHGPRWLYASRDSPVCECTDTSDADIEISSSSWMMCVCKYKNGMHAKATKLEVGEDDDDGRVVYDANMTTSGEKYVDRTVQKHSLPFQWQQIEDS